ncbi:unnamed protein product [Orchesella dallaii]|uniref:Uncharacterized protein n=1 Tax=Orchesella dallaii TaxID=48710 RepID=A0ABP1PTV5_9HEXA
MLVIDRKWRTRPGWRQDSPVVGPFRCASPRIVSVKVGPYVPGGRVSNETNGGKEKAAGGFRWTVGPSLKVGSGRGQPDATAGTSTDVGSSGSQRDAPELVQPLIGTLSRPFRGLTAQGTKVELVTYFRENASATVESYIEHLEPESTAGGVNVLGPGSAAGDTGSVSRGVCRRRKDFSEYAPSTRRRKLAIAGVLPSDVQPEELIITIVKSSSLPNKLEMQNGFHYCLGAPGKLQFMASKMWEKEANKIPFECTPEEALRLILDSDFTVQQYERMRQGVINHNTKLPQLQQRVGCQGSIPAT